MRTYFFLIAFLLIVGVTNAQDVIYQINGKDTTKEAVLKIPISQVGQIRKDVDSETFKTVLNLILKGSKADSARIGDKPTINATVKADDFALENGKQAPQIDGINPVTGKRVESTKNKVVLVNFWATWCAPCISELRMQSFRELVEEFTPNENFRFVAAINDKDIQAQKFVDRVPECGYLKEHILVDEQRLLLSKFASSGIPRTYLIDKKGNIVYQVKGKMNAKQLEELRGVIKQQLAL